MPSTLMVPAEIGCRALMQRISVDFPEPEGPMMQITSPLRTEKVMPLSTSNMPNDFRTSVHFTIGWSAVQAAVMFPRTSTGLEAPLEAGRPQIDRIAIEKEAEQREAIKRRE